MAKDAEAIYLLGDILDFWFEYSTVVPRGFVRLFGTIAAITDSGVKVYWFKGNHDMWTKTYLRDELGVTIIDEDMTATICGKNLYMSHGDNLGRQPLPYRMMRAIFRNEFCRRLGTYIHPGAMVRFAHSWSSHNRLKRSNSVETYRGDDREPAMIFARQYVKEHHDTDYIVCGHLHIVLDRPVPNSHARLVCLGDCFSQWTYGVFDGKDFRIEKFN